MKIRFAMAVSLFSLLAVALPSHAQIIVWGVSQNMTGDTDVVNSGTYVDAASFYTAPLTVNGVTFNAMPYSGNSHTDSTGDITITNGDGTGAYGAPFSTTTPSSTDYSNLVNAGTFGELGVANSSDLVTLSGLTAGQEYQVESWSYYSGDSSSSATTYTGATPVSLNIQSGQYAIGTFVATGSTETYNYYTTGSHNFVNAVSVFDISGSTSTPEPSTYVLIGISVLALVVFRKRFASF